MNRPLAESTTRELAPRGQLSGVVLWCSFLCAAAATMVVFAVLDPHAITAELAPPWWSSRHAVYAIGFFFFWLLAASTSALTLYMTRPGSTPTRRSE